MASKLREEGDKARLDRDWHTALKKCTETLKLQPNNHALYLNARLRYFVYDLKLETAAKEAHRTWTLVGAIQSDRCSGIRIRTRSGTPYVACKLLDEWHNAHPPGKPPCVYEAADSPQRKWKVFDRNGKELKYTIYRIHCKTTPPYPVLVLHDLGSTDSLVGSIDQSAMKPFLAAWKESQAKWFLCTLENPVIFGNKHIYPSQPPKWFKRLVYECIKSRN
ncbi:hypothetical protein SI65_06394 [Aspergillus cristatus]|uniref:Uncharacterized protein n=1 Tax=Aspergillus cristatus TaxID=573508 RepID=A0A1E3BC32_ASPCR|nr:hypothetical protein SI65_06394 [Aspergillus cristatus]